MRSRFLVISFAAALLLIATANCGGDVLVGADKIAWVSTRDGGQEIYVMDADGSNPMRLTDGEARYDDPTWSPDATRLAVSRGSFLYTMNPDGSEQKQLIQEGVQVQLAWSPDGTRIAFASSPRSDEIEDMEVSVIEVDGSGLRNLTESPNTPDGMPDWSPDSGRIVFASFRDGRSDIYVMNADGSGLTNLTNDSASVGSPAWSPDGSRIAFVSDRSGSGDIYVMNADGSGVTQLTARGGGFPTWSPDGSRIAFSSDQDGAPDIFVIDADGFNLMNLTNDPENFDFSPAWSPVP